MTCATCGYPPIVPPRHPQDQDPSPRHLHRPGRDRGRRPRGMVEPGQRRPFEPEADAVARDADPIGMAQQGGGHRPVGAVEEADRADGRVGEGEVGGVSGRDGAGARGDHVPCRETGLRRPAAEDRLGPPTAPDRQIGPEAAGRAADPQLLALEKSERPGDDRTTVGAVRRSDDRIERGARQRQGEVGPGPIDAADHRQLERGGVARVAEQGIGQAER